VLDAAERTKIDVWSGETQEQPGGLAIIALAPGRARHPRWSQFANAAYHHLRQQPVAIGRFIPRSRNTRLNPEDPFSATSIFSLVEERCAE
jgi:hypothetical protein